VLAMLLIVLVNDITARETYKSLLWLWCWQIMKDAQLIHRACG